MATYPWPPGSQPDLTLGAGDEYELRPNDTPTYNLDNERDAKIVAWRLSCLERAGLPLLDASAIALRRDIDREHVERMLGAGATPTQVRAIVL